MTITWEDAESVVPGCSAAWDLVSHRFEGKWEISSLTSPLDGYVVVIVTSPDHDDAYWSIKDGDGWVRIHGGDVKR